jgi:hypothetical protein
MESELCSMKSRPIRKLYCMSLQTTKLKFEVVPATERSRLIIPTVDMGVSVKDFRLRSHGVIRCEKPVSCTKLCETILTQLPESKKQLTRFS